MNSSNTVICSLYFKFNVLWKFLRSRFMYSLACDNGLLFTHNFLMISAAVFVSTPYILLKIQSTNFPFLKKCAHRYPQITISRVSHAFNIYCGGIKCIGFFLSLPVFSQYLYKILWWLTSFCREKSFQRWPPKELEPRNYWPKLPKI